MGDKERNPETNETDSDPTPSEHPSHYLKELSLRLSHNTRIRVATLVVVIIFAISSTWGLNEIFRVGIFKGELEALKLDIEALQNRNDVLFRERERLSSSYSQIQRTSKIPILVYPVNRRPIIGRQITFNWKYSRDQDPGFQNLVLELIKTGEEKLKIRRYQIPEAGRESMIFEFPEGMSGQYFWRVGTGELLSDHEGTRLWSRFGYFSLYPSAIDKIKDTEELLVGTTAKFLSYDHPITCLGDPDDYDIEFARWITAKLKDELHLNNNINMKIKYIEWEKLFSSVINGDVDFAIADITYSKQRETDNYGLVFTKGYRENKQVFIGSKQVSPDTNGTITNKNQIKDRLRGVKVGAQNLTINLDAANHLSRIFGFQVLAGFSSYTDVLNAVHKGEIDYGIIDRLLWESISYPDLERLDLEIEPYIKEMYRKKLGTEKEYYAIAASAKVSNQNFINLLNKLIESQEGQEERRRLEEKHRADNLSARGRDIFDCN